MNSGDFLRFPEWTQLRLEYNENVGRKDISYTRTECCFAASMRSPGSPGRFSQLRLNVQRQQELVLRKEALHGRWKRSSEVENTKWQTGKVSTAYTPHGPACSPPHRSRSVIDLPTLLVDGSNEATTVAAAQGSTQESTLAEWAEKLTVRVNLDESVECM